MFRNGCHCCLICWFGMWKIAETSGIIIVSTLVSILLVFLWYPSLNKAVQSIVTLYLILCISSHLFIWSSYYKEEIEAPGRIAAVACRLPVALLSKYCSDKEIIDS